MKKLKEHMFGTILSSLKFEVHNGRKKAFVSKVALQKKVGGLLDVRWEYLHATQWF